MKIIYTLFLLTAFQLSTFATIYNSSGDDSWSGSSFPTNPSSSDTINIVNGDVITFNHDIEVYGFVKITPTSKIDGSKKIKVYSSGKLTNYGTIDISEELHIDGEFFNYSNAYVMKFHSDGYVYNSGVIKLNTGQEYKHHGGELEGDGTVLADNLDISYNSGVSLNGNSSALTHDQNFCNVAETDTPTFVGSTTLTEFLNNTDSSNSVISGNVTICYSSSPPVPVTLIQFDVKIGINNSAEIYWSTAAELNNAGFEVERSIDGSTWDFIASVNGAGNSNRIINYSTLDRKPIFGESFYRLKQIDYDRTITYYNPVTFNFSEFVSDIIQVYPNPSSTKITIVSKDLITDNLKISSLLGEDLTPNVTITSENGAKSIVMDISHLLPGTYIVSFKNNQSLFIKD